MHVQSSWGGGGVSVPGVEDAGNVAVPVKCLVTCPW